MWPESQKYCYVPTPFQKPAHPRGSASTQTRPPPRERAPAPPSPSLAWTALFLLLVFLLHPLHPHCPEQKIYSEANREETGYEMLRVLTPAPSPSDFLLTSAFPIDFSSFPLAPLSRGCSSDTAWRGHGDKTDRYTHTR